MKPETYTGNFMFRPGLTIKGRIDDKKWDDVTLENVRPVGACARNVIVAADYNGKTYYSNMTAIELTFIFPESRDGDKGIVQHRLWNEHPLISL